MDKFILPNREELQIYEDPNPQLDRATKIVWRGKIGPAMLDPRIELKDLITKEEFDKIWENEND